MNMKARPTTSNYGLSLPRFLFSSLLFVALVVGCTEGHAQSPSQLTTKASAPARTTESERPETLPASQAETFPAGERVSAKASDEMGSEGPASAVTNTPPSQFRVE